MATRGKTIAYLIITLVCAVLAQVLTSKIAITFAWIGTICFGITTILSLVAEYMIWKQKIIQVNKPEDEGEPVIIQP